MLKLRFFLVFFFFFLFYVKACLVFTSLIMLSLYIDIKIGTERECNIIDIKYTVFWDSYIYIYYFRVQQSTRQPVIWPRK